MNTLIIAGSPREGMFSDRIADISKDITQGKLVHLRKTRINPCHACDYCKDINKGECIQKDDMQPLYKDIIDADTIVIVSPIYWWQVTAQTKLFIDRLYALDYSLLEGKRFVVVLNGGESNDNDREYKILHDAFYEMASYLKMELKYLGVGTRSEEDWTNKKDKIKLWLETNLN